MVYSAIEQEVLKLRIIVPFVEKISSAQMKKTGHCVEAKKFENPCR
jgi:hypothetical protein